MAVQTNHRSFTSARGATPRRASAPKAPNASPRAQAISTPVVEGLLTDLLAAYGELEALASEHRGAISRADGDAVESCARREADLAARLAELEERRRAIAATGAGLPGQRVTISSMIERLPDAERGRATELASRLRELVRKAQREYATIRAATQSIVAHIDGLVQQVSQRLNGTGTYGREGRVDPGKTVAGGIDVTR